MKKNIENKKANKTRKDMTVVFWSGVSNKNTINLLLKCSLSEDTKFFARMINNKKEISEISFGLE